MYFKRPILHIQIFFCFLIHLVTRGLQDKALRIMGGRDAVPGEFSYMAKMEIKVQKKSGIKHVFLCTCTLLKPTWSLTAAHCIRRYRKELSKSSSRKGIIKYNISSETESPYSNIVSTFQHPNFRLRKNDIGLLLTEKIAVTIFGKLSSVNYLTLYGSKVLALGYGKTMSANGTYGDAHSIKKPLQVLDVIITKCFRSTFNPSFCLGGICGQTPYLCSGDSGGAVLHDSGVVGVNVGSFFKTCKPRINFHNFAGIITPASPYIDWVINVIRSNSL